MAHETILVVDDEIRIREMLSTVLEDEGFSVITADSGESALQMVEKQIPDLVLLDVWMPGIDGLDTLRRLKELLPNLMVIIISGHANIELAVKATRLGAYDFIEKPLNLDKLLLAMERAFQAQELSQRYDLLKQEVEKKHRIVGESPAIRNVLHIIETAAPSNARVLISGENGTGKELVARALHNLSPRREGPFVEVNCAAIPEELIESELFGHEKGAFTGASRMKKGKFELASKGTIFLDEIGDMSLKTQAKVLRVLEEQSIERVGSDKPIKIDVRVIAASNKSLPDLIAKGEFREDLFFRLNVIEIHVPRLVERKEDLPVLAEHFLALYAKEYGKRKQALHPETLRLMTAYHWPGNIRELRNVIERLVILCQEQEIPPQMLPPAIRRESTPDLSVATAPSFVVYPSLKDAREEFERQYITEMLRRNDGNITRTADLLGIERTNLHRKLKALGLVADGD